MWIFVVGLFIAIAANASTFDVAEKLWRDPVTRQAVAETAGRVATDESTQTEITSVAETTDQLTELGLPIGWDQATRDEWTHWNPFESWSRYGTVLGWIVTALLVMLGAPFWFDVLTKLASSRSAGAKPPTAATDPSSATSSIESTATPGLRRAEDETGFEANLRAALGL